MVKIKNKILLPILLLCMLILTVPVMAEEPIQTAGVFDDAYLFTEEETDDILVELEELQRETGWAIFAFTTYDAEGYTSMEYAEYAFDDVTTSMDGLALLIDMDNREIAFVHFGEANRYYTDDRVDAILDEAYPYVSDGEYAEAMETMIEEASYYYDKGIPEGQYNYDVETGRRDYAKKLTLIEILITALVALGAGGAFFGVTVGKYRLHWDSYKYDYHKNSTMNLTKRSDRFVNQVVTHRHIERDTSSGGGGRSGGGRTSVHRGAGGRSVGGGSRKF